MTFHDEHGFPLGEPPEPEFSEWAKRKANKTRDLPCPDKVDVPDMRTGKIGKAERAFYWLQTSPTVRRVGKAITAVALLKVLPVLGVSDNVTAGLTVAYWGAEKKLNMEVGKKTGKNENYDLLTLIFKIVELIIKAVQGKRDKSTN